MKRTFLIIGYIILVILVGSIINAYIQIRYHGGYIKIEKDNKFIIAYDNENEEFIIWGFKRYHLDGIDGPYINKDKDQFEIITVEKRQDRLEIIQQMKPLEDSLLISVKVANEDQDSFEVAIKIKEAYSPGIQSITARPESLLVLSDIEGNFNALYSLLLNNKVMNAEYEWTFGQGHVVCVGDFVDRGSNVVPCLWLLYHLQHIARNHGGKLHFVLGNHEVMNLLHNVKYVSGKQLALGQQLTNQQNPRIGYERIFPTSSILIQWLKQQPIILKLGEYLFVHAGISPEFFARKWTVSKLNEGFYHHLNVKADPEFFEKVYDSDGPLWYREMAKGTGDQLTDDFDKMLEFYGVDQIVIGHTIVDKISYGYDRRLIKIDVEHGELKNSTESKALFIQNTEQYEVDGAGNRRLLNAH